MLTLEDCIGFSGLTSEQVEAIAHHEHLSMILAAELAENLLESPKGVALVEAILNDEVAYCQTHGNNVRRAVYQAGLDQFLTRHHRYM